MPDDLDDVTAAAIANPGMSSWAALVDRARLAPGETVLVNGATGTAGRLAVQIAKHLGAKKVIATGRNPETLASLAALGADATIALSADDAALEESFRGVFAEKIDVVLDYLWGRSAELLLSAAAKAAPKSPEIRFVQIGAVTGGQISLRADVLRSTPIEIMGSGLGSVPGPRLVAAIGAVFAAAKPAGLQVATRTVPLAGSRAPGGRPKTRGAWCSFRSGLPGSAWLRSHSRGGPRLARHIDRHRRDKGEQRRTQRFATEPSGEPRTEVGPCDKSDDHAE